MHRGRACRWAARTSPSSRACRAAGKTAAAKLFEDLGYIVVDNLPGELLPDLAELVAVGPDALRAGRDRPRRAGRRRAARLRRDARRARRPRHPAAGVLPRGARRGPHPPLLRDAAPPPARRPARASRARSPTERRAAGAVRARGGRHHRHDATFRCASCASGCSPTSATCPGPDQLAIQLISFGYKYGVRSRPTSSSTSASCRTRTTSRAAAPVRA